MCGVAGIFSYHYASPGVSREELRTIRDYMTARGPDGKGEWYSGNGRVALGHRRLAIIDLTDEAAQPMATEDGQLVISFNGEIYNYKALRQELQQKGYRFRTRSDTEVLLHLYAEKGEAMVHDLRGMFAFSLWDVKKQAMLLARDPYGIKPLYYADDGWTLRLASQVKAIMSGGKVSRKLEPAGIVGFYLFGSVPEPFTTYQDVRAVPAGSYLWVDSTGPAEPIHYFSIARTWAEAEQGASNNDNLQQQVREALLDSVRHHMVSDVPVGAFLSAGIDSGALVGLMSEIQGVSPRPIPIQTITLAFEEFKGSHNDESPLAAKVAALYGTRHTTRYVTEKEFQQDLPGIMEAMDQPTIDGINTWFVAKAAKEQGLKVAVSGLGGDELFGGYPSFSDVPRWVKGMYIPSRIPLLGDAARWIGGKIIPYTSINPKAAGMIKYGGDWSGAWFLRRGLFMPWELSQVMDSDIAKCGLDRLQQDALMAASLQPDPASAYARVATLESSLYMRNQLLRDADWAGMAHSLEIRVPFVDSGLLKQLVGCLPVPGATNPKRVIAESPATPIPVNVSERAKSGFTTPVEKWQKNSNNLQTWRTRNALLKPNCPWARRWAYVVGERTLAFEK